MSLTDAQLGHLARWLETSFRRGCTIDTVRAQLVKDGFQKPDIDALLEGAYDTSKQVDYEAIYNAAITRRVENTPGLKRVLTKKAQIYTWENFLTANECERLVGLIDAKSRPSTVTDEFADKQVRTSSTSDLNELMDPFVFLIDDKISQAVGFHWSYADGNQGQKYEVGQEFKAHHDYFKPGTPEYQPFCQFRGQRTWTFMIYLNDTPAGGGTRFRKLEKTFYPKTGNAVIWNNLNRDGSVNPNTLHHGMKVREGQKYIITKWYREYGWGDMANESDDLLTVDTSTIAATV